MRAPTPKDSPVVLLDSSDELYAADQILLDTHDALTPEWAARAEFWLPTDTRTAPPHCAKSSCVGVPTCATSSCPCSDVAIARPATSPFWRTGCVFSPGSCATR